MLAIRCRPRRNAPSNSNEGRIQDVHGHRQHLPNMTASLSQQLNAQLVAMTCGFCDIAGSDDSALLETAASTVLKPCSAARNAARPSAAPPATASRQPTLPHRQMTL